MLISWNLHEKSSQVSIKTRSSLSFIGQVTKHTTLKWSIVDASWMSSTNICAKTTCEQSVGDIRNLFLRRCSSLLFFEFSVTHFGTDKDFATNLATAVGRHFP